jgi:protein SCO1/2
MTNAFCSSRRAALLALAASLCLAACDQAAKPGKPAAAPKVEAKFNAVDITGADYARKLSLPDYDGRPRDLSEFKGKLIFIFFGYTQCPDVCPTTMAELAEVKRRLGADGARVQGVFVTIDPERDTSVLLKAYLHGMDPSFLGLRGTMDQTEAVSREFKVFYQKVPTSNGGYTMDHTAGAFVFDTTGQVRLFARYGLGVDALTADLKQLLAAAPAPAPEPSPEPSLAASTPASN